MYDRLKEEFRTAEYGMQVCICEPEQGSFLDEDEDRDAEEKIIEGLTNYWTSSDQHEDLLMKESNGARESYDFKTDHLCVVGGNEQLSNAVMKMEEDERGQNSNSVQREDEEYWNDILIQFDEEMKFLEEEIETFLFLEEMPGIENFLFQEEELEDEVCLMEYEYTYNEGGGATTLKESDKYLMNNLEESSIA